MPEAIDTWGPVVLGPCGSGGIITVVFAAYDKRLKNKQDAEQALKEAELKRLNDRDKAKEARQKSIEEERRQGEPPVHHSSAAAAEHGPKHRRRAAASVRGYGRGDDKISQSMSSLASDLAKMTANNAQILEVVRSLEKELHDAQATAVRVCKYKPESKGRVKRETQ